MKILSYNLYGKKETNLAIPDFDTRIKNLTTIINNIIKEDKIDVMCFQEVNDNNLKFVEEISNNNGYIVVNKFPMRTRTINQYNIIAIKKSADLKMNNIICIPHGKDEKYKSINNQVIDYGMSDYRTTVCADINYKNKKYLISNVHTDHLSLEGRIKGLNKSLKVMESINCDYRIIVGDMNMEMDSDDAIEVLKQNPNYTILKNKSNNIVRHSYHGYNLNGPYNVDFAFIEKSKINCYNYKIIRQDDIMKEGSDHRPIIIEIDEK